MDIFKKILGNIIYGLGKLLDVIFQLLISITELIVRISSGIARLVFGLIGIGGFFLLFLFLGPLGLILLVPIMILLIVLFIVIPILGTKVISYLKYRQYMVTQYLFDWAEYYISGKKKAFDSFDKYGDKYKDMEEEKRREEWRKRQEEQQKMWEERFRQWYEYENAQRSQGNYTGGNYYGNYGRQESYVNPAIEFNKKYEESCNILGVGYDTDIYEVKLAYRKKAKEYHPDLNKSPNATEMFQKINAAYEFLSEGNIARYKSYN
ncbi:J domain-containing protein [Wansuia hejianensis]|uniref:DnaJ domain-containing protein n=1 Tax=Wansuia hejianensis TaxID=2763667 RepID=A0A926EW66_9FIRM|nr:DnaJ domain-containing protein [Wansuia hejianensis]MBC8589625.1 DnaJ domain-containing protein [Wansuia hejianensis]